MTNSLGAGKSRSPYSSGFPVTRIVCKPSSNTIDNDLGLRQLLSLKQNHSRCILLERRPFLISSKTRRIVTNENEIISAFPTSACSRVMLETEREAEHGGVGDIRRG